MELADIAWGDVISDSDGVLVVEGTLRGDPVVVKRYAAPQHRREIANYALLGRLGVPTLPVLGSGPDWLVLADAEDAGYRLGTPDDLDDPHVARLLARWYATLHAAGEQTDAADLAGLYSELDVVDAAGLARIADRWPELALPAAWAQEQLPHWRHLLADLRRTLTYNDFWYTNLAVHWTGASALMFDHNLLGAGLRSSDLRNVTVSLSERAASAFRDEYEALVAGHGVRIDPREAAFDEPLSHLATLVFAAEAEQTPRWADASLAWLAAAPH